MTQVAEQTQVAQALPSLPPGVVSFFGNPGTLKTSYGYTWPKPVRVYDFDMGAHRGWQYAKLVRSGDLLVVPMPIPAKSITTRHEKLSGFSAMWQAFTADFSTYCERKDVPTIQIDTSTMLWALVHDAYLEELQTQNIRDSKPVRRQLIQIEFREPNSRMKTLLNSARSYGKHILLVHHETDEYAPIMMGGKPLLDENNQPKSAPTGRRVPDGFRYTEGLADWVFRTRVEKRPDPETQVVSNVPIVNIAKSALGIDLVGLDVEQFSYSKLVQMLATLERL